VGERTATGPSQRTASRADLIARAALAAGALAAGGFWLIGRAGSAASAPSKAQDERIFNYALGLEYAQAAFYGQAVEEGALDGDLLEFAEEVGEQERRHVSYLQRALGEAALEEPSFDFRELVSDAERFGQSAFVLEESGVGAYIGQAANLTVAGVAAAAPIISVEARHAAWIRDILGENPAPRAADPARTVAQVQSALERAGFRTPGLGA
jgi:Ferritin-like domain